MNRLEVDFLGVRFPNPVVTASGTFNFGREYAHLYPLSRLGAVTTKGVSPRPIAGAPTPRITETPMGMLNAIGLENKGVDAYVADELPWLKAQGARVIVNVFGDEAADFAHVARKVGPYADLIEVNLSCPNVHGGNLPFAHDPAAAAEVVHRVKGATDRPVLAKLSPNGPILPVAEALEAAGVDGFSLINTLLGMRMDLERRRPVLGNRQGGLSGPAIKPVAVRLVYELYRHTDRPILGMGGIASAEDALEFALAGARLVAVGTATFANPYAPVQIIEELANVLEARNERWEDWIGTAHTPV
ncbi:dihydroorotate dehydrogenase [Oceanithermus sp.]